VQPASLLPTWQSRAVERQAQLLCGVASCLSRRGLADFPTDALDLLKHRRRDIRGLLHDLADQTACFLRLDVAAAQEGLGKREQESWPILRPVRPNSLDRSGQSLTTI